MREYMWVYPPIYGFSPMEKNGYGERLGRQKIMKFRVCIFRRIGLNLAMDLHYHADAKGNTASIEGRGDKRKVPA